MHSAPRGLIETCANTRLIGAHYVDCRRSHSAQICVLAGQDITSKCDGEAPFKFASENKLWRLNTGYVNALVPLLVPCDSIARVLAFTLLCYLMLTRRMASALRS